MTNGMMQTRRPRKAATRPFQQRGVALLIVLWVSIMIVVIGSAMTFSAHTEVELTTHFVESARASALAEAGINRAIVGLLHRDRREKWASDGRPYWLKLNEDTVSVTVKSENGKMDLNRASEPLLRGLLAAVAETGVELPTGDVEDIADVIIDWRDRDDRRKVHGAEDADYRSAGYPYGARDQNFSTVSELKQVLGMTQALFQAIEPAFTVYSGSTKIDPATASRLVLLAIPGLTPESVDEFIAQREALLDAAKTLEAAEDEEATPVKMPVEILSAGNRYLSSANTRVFTVRANAMTAAGGRAALEVVVRTARNRRKPYTILDWSRVTPGEAIPVAPTEDETARESS